MASQHMNPQSLQSINRRDGPRGTGAEWGRMPGQSFA